MSLIYRSMLQITAHTSIQVCSDGRRATRNMLQIAAPMYSELRCNSSLITWKVGLHLTSSSIHMSLVQKRVHACDRYMYDVSDVKVLQIVVLIF